MSMRRASLKTAGKAREAHHQSNMYSTVFSVVSHAKIGTIKKLQRTACYVILPLQSTIGDIHISRTIGIGLQKQWVIPTYVQIQVEYRYSRGHVFSNEQVL